MTKKSTHYSTREDWLRAAVNELRPFFRELDVEPVDEIEPIVSWPKGKASAIGQCFSPEWTKEGVTYVTISPELGDDPVRVLDVLLHEMIHACGIHGHKGDFRKVALAVGLEGKMTATVASDELREELKPIADALGDYPHMVMAKLDGGGEEKKSTPSRVRLFCVNEECDQSGIYTVDINARKFEEGELIAPLCPHCTESMDQGGTE